MGEPDQERVAVFDAFGRAAGALSREDAKRSGRALGAVNVLLVNAAGEVLLQRRQPDKENGDRWDKSVGGHVDEGEGFDEAAVREAGEELFGDARAPRVRLLPDLGAVRDAATGSDLRRDVLFAPVARQLGLRDVRILPGGGGIRNVLYHVAVYLGRTDVPLGGFRPAGGEISALRYATPAEVDAMLLRGDLAPNMAFLWLAHARALLDLAGLAP